MANRSEQPKIGEMVWNLGEVVLALGLVALGGGLLFDA